MLTNHDKIRYQRHISLQEIGIAGQEKLKQSRVLVVGAGGLGCPILQYLTAAGVGTIGIVDFDVVDETNLQRQILFTHEDIDKNKANCAKKRLTHLNPHIDIHSHPIKLTPKNALELFEQYDIVVDGTDNFSTRYLINDACIISGKPLVYGAIYKFEGQVAVFNYENGPSYRCLFPEIPAEDSIPNCSEVGVLGVLPGIIGTFQANEVLKILLNIGEVLSGKLLIYNTLNHSHTLLNVAQSPVEIEKVLAQKASFSDQNYELLCGVKKQEYMQEIDASALKEMLQQEDIQVIDVREEWEEPKVAELRAINIPMSSLLDNLDKIDRTKKKVIYCQHGIRSLNCINYLQENNYTNLINLTGGIVTWK